MDALHVLDVGVGWRRGQGDLLAGLRVLVLSHHFLENIQSADVDSCLERRIRE
jgi:hypothetical protein